MILGERVKKLRKSLGLSQREFMQRVSGKVNSTYISTIERGHQYPSLKLLERIGMAYSVPVSYFFEDNRESKQGMFHYTDLLDWFDAIARDFEWEAEQYLKHKDYIGYGAGKTLAIQIRAMMHRLTERSIEGGGRRERRDEK